MKLIPILILLVVLGSGCRFFGGQNIFNQSKSPQANAPLNKTPIEIATNSKTMPTNSAFDSSKLGGSDKDVTYCTMENIALKMDVYYPSGQKINSGRLYCICMEVPGKRVIKGKVPVFRKFPFCGKRVFWLFQ